MIKVDQNKCSGCGVCEALCPEVFKVEEKSSVINQDWEDCDCDIENAISSCPENAISKE